MFDLNMSSDEDDGGTLSEEDELPILHPKQDSVVSYSDATGSHVEKGSDVKCSNVEKGIGKQSVVQMEGTFGKKRRLTGAELQAASDNSSEEDELLLTRKSPLQKPIQYSVVPYSNAKGSQMERGTGEQKKKVVQMEGTFGNKLGGPGWERQLRESAPTKLSLVRGRN